MRRTVFSRSHLIALHATASLSRTLAAGFIHRALRLMHAERQRGHRTFAREPSPMRSHVPRQAGELAGLAAVGLAQLRCCTGASTSVVSNSSPSTRTVFSIKAA